MTSLELLRAVTTPFQIRSHSEVLGVSYSTDLWGRHNLPHNRLPKKSSQTVGCRSYNTLKMRKSEMEKRFMAADAQRGELRDQNTMCELKGWEGDLCDDGNVHILTVGV